MRSMRPRTASPARVARLERAAAGALGRAARRRSGPLSDGGCGRWRRRRDREFRDHRFDAELEGQPLAQADQPFFARLAQGVVGAQKEVDTTITQRLAVGWRLRSHRRHGSRDPALRHL